MVCRLSANDNDPVTTSSIPYFLIASNRWRNRSLGEYREQRLHRLKFSVRVEKWKISGSSGNHEIGKFLYIVLCRGDDWLAAEFGAS